MDFHNVVVTSGEGAALSNTCPHHLVTLIIEEKEEYKQKAVDKRSCSEKD